MSRHITQYLLGGAAILIAACMSAPAACAGSGPAGTKAKAAAKAQARGGAASSAASNSASATTSAQPVDAEYTAKIREYTTEPYLMTPLVDHLPASETVPTPDKILGYVIGTPDKLTHTRSEERRVGKECRARGAPEHEKKESGGRRSEGEMGEH